MAEFGRGMLFPDRWAVDNDHEDPCRIDTEREITVVPGKPEDGLAQYTRTELVKDEAGWTIQSADPNYDEQGNLIDFEDEPF